MNNRPTQQLFPQLLLEFSRLAGPVAGLAILIDASGCASRRPISIVVRHQQMSQTPGNPRPELNLKIVTYNIWGLPSWMTGARVGRYSQIARELERLSPDIVLLQEAWTAKARKSVPEDGPWSVARASGQHTFFQQSGLVTLSKFPILGGEFYPFSRAAFPDRFVNKGVLKVTLLLPGGRVLNVWNVHLQDGGGLEVRRSQVIELLARVKSAEDGQIADIVGGDFNCTPDSSLYQQLAASLGPTVQQLGGMEPFVTWDGLSNKPGAGETLDHIFICARATFQNLRASPRAAFVSRDVERRLSDHFGIEAEVSLSTVSSLASAAGAAPASAGASGAAAPVSSPASALPAESIVYAGSE